MRSRILIAYENNLVVIYDFDKEKIEQVFDVCSAYNDLFEKDPKPISRYINPCVIKDAKFSIDSSKIMVAVTTSKLLIFKYGKKTSIKAMQICAEEVDEISLSSYWFPESSDKKLYVNSGETHCMFMIKQKLEEIVNTPGKGLEVSNYTKVTFKQNGKLESIDTGPNVIKRLIC